jgi:hypothetical protein
MERSLFLIVIVRDVQPCRSGLFNDPPVQRRDFGRLFRVLRVPGSLANPGDHLKRSADKLDRAFHAGAVLRESLSRQVRQFGQPVQVSVQTGQPERPKYGRSPRQCQ